MAKRANGQKREVVVVLCDIRSVHNAGAIMRTADGIGAQRIIFAGVTPGPLDRFGRVRSDFAKASLGSEKNIPFEVYADSMIAVRSLKDRGVYIVAVEQHRSAVDYKRVNMPVGKPIAILFGSETKGLSPRILSLADTIADIPMRGRKESLNVSVAAGIALYRFFDDVAS